MSVPTTALQVWLEILDRIPWVLHRVLADIDPDALAWRPDAEANSIALTAWHIARALDWLATTVVGGQPAEKQLWHRMGWAERTGYDPRGHGHGGIGTLRSRLDLVPLDEIPVDDLAQPRTLWDGNASIRIQGVDGLRQPGILGIVIEEGVEQAPLIVLARDAHGAQDLQVAGAAAVDL